jgi:hypothetical protein
MKLRIRGKRYAGFHSGGLGEGGQGCCVNLVLRRGPERLSGSHDRSSTVAIAYAYRSAAEQDFVRLMRPDVRKCHRRAIKT